MDRYPGFNFSRCFRRLILARDFWNSGVDFQRQFKRICRPINHFRVLPPVRHRSQWIDRLQALFFVVQRFVPRPVGDAILGREVT